MVDLSGQWLEPHLRIARRLWSSNLPRVTSYVRAQGPWALRVFTLYTRTSQWQALSSGLQVPNCRVLTTTLLCLFCILDWYTQTRRKGKPLWSWHTVWTFCLCLSINTTWKVLVRWNRKPTRTCHLQASTLTPLVRFHTAAGNSEFR